jgi:hypothetical protein
MKPTALNWTKQVNGWRLCSPYVDDYKKCDLIIGEVDLKPLLRYGRGCAFKYLAGFYDLRQFDMWDEFYECDQQDRRMISMMLMALGIYPNEFRIVHKINEEMREFVPKDKWKVKKNLAVTEEEARQVGLYFALADDFDEEEFLAFNALVKHALETRSIKAILRINNVAEWTAQSDDYYWIIIYNRSPGGDG